MFKIKTKILDEEDSNQFELKTKTGNIWGSKDKIEDLKQQYLQREENKIDNRKRNITNFVIASVILIFIICFLVLQKKYNWWF